MKNIIAIFITLFFSITASGSENNKMLNMTCQDYNWSDVEILVQPYLDDVLFTALVMQGQSSNYNVSAAAEQAMDKSLPDTIKRILNALIKADC
jgi:hypothetical protein